MKHREQLVTIGMAGFLSVNGERRLTSLTYTKYTVT